MSLKINVYGNSIPGKVRNLNEDSFSYNDKRGQYGSLFIVCDGVGGHKAGEIASNYASKKFIEYFFKSSQRDILSRLKQTSKKINEEIYSAALKDNTKKGMGTTLVAAFIFQDKLYIVNIGDSRAYLIRDGILKKLTVDNSIVEDLVRNGAITPAEAKKHPKKNQITRCIGYESDVEVDIYTYLLKENDKIILCSDGLWGELDDTEINKIINEHDNVKESVNNLLQNANKKGGRDNITCIGIEYGTSKVSTARSKKSFAVLGLSILSIILALGLLTETIFLINSQIKLRDRENIDEVKDETPINSGEEGQDNEAVTEIDNNSVNTEVDNNKEENIVSEVEEVLNLFEVQNLPESIFEDKQSELIVTPGGNIILLNEGKLYICKSIDKEESSNSENQFKEIGFEKDKIDNNIDISDILIIDESFNEDSDENYRICFITQNVLFYLEEGWSEDFNKENSSYIEIKDAYVKELFSNIADGASFIVSLERSLYSFQPGDNGIVWKNISDDKTGLIQGKDLIDLTKITINGIERIAILVKNNDKEEILFYDIDKEELVPDENLNKIIKADDGIAIKSNYDVTNNAYNKLYILHKDSFITEVSFDGNSPDFKKFELLFNESKLDINNKIIDFAVGSNFYLISSGPSIKLYKAEMDSNDRVE